MKVPFCQPGMVNAELARPLYEAYHRVMTSGNYILGAEVAAFESEWAEYCDRAYCVGVGNGLDALTLMLRAFGVGPGDEVIVPANTYIATWLAVTAVGAIPVPVDPDPGTHNIDPHAAFKAVGGKTKAILAVHLYGRPANIKALRALVPAEVCPILVDAAQAHGIKGAELGDAAAFSFYPTKNLGALGDAGAVVTNQWPIKEALVQLRNYGATTKDQHVRIGVNSRLDELQAAFLRTKLPYLDEHNARRQRNATIYGGGWDGSVWHQFVVRAKDRAAYRTEFAARGIGTAIHYPTPPHLQPAYASLGYRVGSFPIAEQLANEVVSLPIGPEVSQQMAEYVAETAFA